MSLKADAHEKSLSIIGPIKKYERLFVNGTKVSNAIFPYSSSSVPWVPIDPGEPFDLEQKRRQLLDNLPVAVDLRHKLPPISEQGDIGTVIWDSLCGVTDDQETGTPKVRTGAT